MNKNLVIVLAVIIAVLGLGVAGWFFLIKKSPSQMTSDTLQDESTVADGESLGGEIKKGLLDLVTTGAGTKCTVEDETGKYTMYAKGDKAKVEGISLAPMNPASGQSAEPGTMINDGTWAYMWSGKEGMKFNIKEMQDLSAQNQNQPQSDTQEKAADWKDWVKSMQESGAKYECGADVLSDADFVPPTDVKFQDWGELMKSLMQSVPQNIPSGIPQNIPGGALPNVAP